MTTLILLNAFASLFTLVACLTALWLISLKMKDASIIDIFWGAGFAVVGLVCLGVSKGQTLYIWLLGGLPIIWGVRLSLYLAKRNLGHGEDKRYINMRKRAEDQGMSETDWRKRSFYTIYLGQGLLIMIVSAPVWFGIATAHKYQGFATFGEGLVKPNPAPTQIGLLAIIGAVLWLIGFLFEAIGDAQLKAFLAKNKDYVGPIEHKPVMDQGLWKYTRHPNYFGNACMWWGIYIIACTAPWAWVTIFAPIIMTILLVKVSGKGLLERDMGQRKSYQDYIARTSGFFPMPPKSRV